MTALPLSFRDPQITLQSHCRRDGKVVSWDTSNILTDLLIFDPVYNTFEIQPQTITTLGTPLNRELNSTIRLYDGSYLRYNNQVDNKLFLYF